MRVLFSWIAMKEDLVMGKKSGIISGPTLQLLFSEKFDVLHLFSSDKKSHEKASKLKSYVEDNQTKKLEFEKNKNIKINVEYLPLKSPADYQILWKKLPQKVGTIIGGYKDQEIEVCFNLSSGTRAMTATWLMMVGTGQFSAKLLSPQLVEKSGAISIDQIDARKYSSFSGIFPFVNELKEKIDRDLGLVNKFKSEEMQKIIRELTILAHSTTRPILLLGETGTGKTKIASQYHEMTGRTESSFQAVVCGQFRGSDLNIVKSTLFGHEKGAYTDAREKTSGMLAKANGGTLFLDEIGDIPMEAQRLLIDAVENKTFKSLGSNDVQHSDFQLMCATNRDIQEMLKSQSLSQDFYYRISSYEFIIPPLRERPDDIAVILSDLLESRDYSGLVLDEIASDELIDCLKKSSLPRNIRGVLTILDHLVLKSKIPETHNLTAQEVKKYFDENKEPTLDDDFADAVRKSLLHWDHTSHAERDKKWRDTFVDVAVKILSERPDYKKRGGELNIRKLSQTLGIDPKTINNRLEGIKF